MEPGLSFFLRKFSTSNSVIMKTRRSSYRLPQPPAKKRKKKVNKRVEAIQNKSKQEEPPSHNEDSTACGNDEQGISSTHRRTSRLHHIKSADGKFPFQELPRECQVKIFSYLSDKEKCQCAWVCQSWAHFMRTPRLWTHANFKRLFIILDQNGRETIARPSASEYQRMKAKVRDYVYHLVSRKAFLKSLEFSFDLQEGDEIWLKLLVHCLNETNSKELLRVGFNWIHTPHPYMFLDSASYTKSSRIMCFHKFLNALHDICPNVKFLAMPFDWSPLSIHLLSLYQNVKSLELYKYWVFRGTSQSSINRLLDNLPNLERLKIEVAVKVRESESYPQYTICSKSLKELDIRESNGFFLWSVTLPKLETFYATRGHWSGPMIDRDHLKIPCLYTVLHDGAPRLRYYNDYVLEEDWRVICGPKLEEALKLSCFCKKHKRGALIY